MPPRTLQDVMDAAPDWVEALRNSRSGAYVYPVVAPEFSNWRDEQRAWRESAVLFDQSHHMAELLLDGPDAERLLSETIINSVADWPVGRAKHVVPVSSSGHVIGDVIGFRDDTMRFNLVGRVPSVTWFQFHAETGGYDVIADRDDRSPSRPMGRPVTRRHYRFQVQGPAATKILERVHGGPLPDIRFFRTGRINVGQCRVRALRHGMAGVPGLELWGPYPEGDTVRSVLLDAGADFGLTQVGSRAYASNTLESGWIPSPLPAVYTGGDIEARYRRWLPASAYEATGSIGGSFVSGSIEDYYCTPHDLGYGFYIRFDHDFIGREALEAMHDRPHRRKVTFEWNPEDVARIHASHLRPGLANFKTIDIPISNYAATSADRVMKAGRIAGLSMFAGYSYNERAQLSLGFVEPGIEEDEVLTLVWGEEDGGTAKTTVERHVQTEIRVRVAKVPYSAAARESYADSWRTRQ
ncbi:MAG: aminomethyl transferase family protein [Paracoccaceae bacterium]|nr:aminomethyl transferase family protein [Paracoccaceae bacterium]